MAKKSSNKKRSSPRSSKKVKPRKVVKPQPKRAVKSTRYSPPKKTVKKKPVKKQAKRVNYKNEYVKLLEKNLRSLKRDVTAIKKQINQPEAKDKPIQWSGKPKQEPKEAFPIEDDILFTELPKSQQEALEMIAEMQRQINQRNIMLDEMMSAEGKLY